MSAVDRYFREPRTGQMLPEGTLLQHLLASVFPHVHAEAERQVRNGAKRVLLHSWAEAIGHAATPLVGAYFRRGWHDRAMDLLKRVRRPIRKALPATNPKYGFAMGSPEVAKAIRDMTMEFAESTIATLSKDIDDAAEAVRRELLAAHDAREPRERIIARMKSLFSDSHRAARIGATEACRAAMAGSVAAAVESGVCTGGRWVAERDACHACKALDGTVKDLGQPFMILDNVKPLYRVVMHPPLHPLCRCSWRPTVDVSKIHVPTVEEHLREMARIGQPAKPEHKPRPSKPRVWPGAFQADLFYWENGRRIPHPDDPLKGQWEGPWPHDKRF